MLPYFFKKYKSHIFAVAKQDGAVAQMVRAQDS